MNLQISWYRKWCFVQDAFLMRTPECDLHGAHVTDTTSRNYPCSMSLNIRGCQANPLGVHFIPLGWPAMIPHSLYVII